MKGLLYFFDSSCFFQKKRMHLKTLLLITGNTFSFNFLFKNNLNYKEINRFLRGLLLLFPVDLRDFFSFILFPVIRPVFPLKTFSHFLSLFSHPVSCDRLSSFAGGGNVFLSSLQTLFCIRFLVIVHGMKRNSSLCHHFNPLERRWSCCFTCMSETELSIEFQ